MPLLITLFFFSGFSALLNELLWQRYFIITFGASQPALVAVLSGFFLGIALGSHLASRMLHRIGNPMRFYGMVEILIGAGSALVPFFILATDVLYTRCFTEETQSGTLSHLFRFTGAVLVVLPSTLGMGATIPLMSRLLKLARGTRRIVFGHIYGLNVLGSLAGCFLGGFILLPRMGTRNTLLFSSAVSILVGLCALLRSPGYAGRNTEPSLPTGPPPRRILLAYFLAGALAIGYEVVWFRILSILSTNSFVTFTTGLSTYLLGFSLGGLALYPRLSRRFHPATLFTASQWLTGLCTLCLIAFYYLIPWINHVLLSLFSRDTPLSLSRLAILETLTAAIVMFIPTLFLGLAFPALVDVYSPRNPQGERPVGGLYFWGTLGSAAGSALFGLVLVPGMGIVATLGLLCASSLLLALGLQHVWVPALFSRRLRQALLVPLFLSIAYAVSGPPFVKDGFVRTNGAFLVQRHLDNPAGVSRILRYQSGRSATVIIKEETERPGDPARRRVYVDDQLVASTDPDAVVDAKMLAHLPLLLHPHPRRALTVGFGSGGTTWSMSRHGIQVDVVEIEPEVVRSADLLETQNHGVLRYEQLAVRLNDARDHLHLCRTPYDVISTDVTNLQYKQNAYLYTREYFDLLKKRLAPGGVACAWIPLTGISKDELKILLRTFHAAFPHSTLWYLDELFTRFAILIGTEGPPRFDHDRLMEAFRRPDIRSDLAAIAIEHPYELARFLYLDAPGYEAFAGAGDLHTDDLPLLEFSAAPCFFSDGREIMDFLEAFLKLRPASSSPVLSRLPDEAGDLFRRYESFSAARGTMALHAGFLRYARTPREEIHHVENIIRQGEAALALFPDRKEIAERVLTYRSRLR